MHELAVTESLLAIVVQSAKENRAQKVTDITLSIGALSSIIDDSVQFYWNHISKGTVAEKATLHLTVSQPPCYAWIAAQNLHSKMI